MATDPNQQNVHITGTDLPEWASETTQQGILNAIKVGDSNNVKLVSNMNTLMGNLISIMAGDRNAAKTYRESIRKSQEESSEIRKQLSELNTTIETVSQNTEQTNNDNRSREKKDDDRVDRQISQIKQLGMFDKIKFRADMAMAKSQKEQLRVMNNYLGDISLSSKELKNKFPEVLEKLGAPAAIADGPGNDIFGGLMALTGKANLAKNVIDTAFAAYSASQVPLQMMMQQVKDRFEITTELRQSGLLEDMSASFAETTDSFNKNNMTIVEATQFVREFSKAVGVTGTNAALEFVNKTAYATDIMERYGVNFSQVAKISGTYLDTLERTGLLEQISASERDRGLQSFMSAVEGVSMTLKTSLEESAKMIRDYLSRDDVSAMLMTNSLNLSQEVIAQIGAMAKMGPLGEIISKGAIDPNRFMLTQEFQALNNPALTGIRNIVEQMMSDLRSGRGTDELIAQYGKQMSDIIANDPVVAQLVAMDSDVASIVAGVGRLAQTSQDAIKDIVPPEVDKAEQRRQDAERRKALAAENIYTNIINTLEASGKLQEILEDQTDILNLQISAMGKVAERADEFGALLVSIGNEAHNAIVGSLSMLADGLAELFPERHIPGKERDIADTAAELTGDIELDRSTLAKSIGEERLKQINDAMDQSWVYDIVTNLKSPEDRMKELEDVKALLSASEEESAYIDTFIDEQKVRNLPNFGGRMAGTHISQLMIDRVYSQEDSFWNPNRLMDYENMLSGKVEATDEEKSHAAEVIKDAQQYAVRARFEEILPDMRDTQGEWNDQKRAVLAQESVNAMREAKLTTSEVSKIVSSLFSDPAFKSNLGVSDEQFEMYRQALLSELPTQYEPVDENTRKIIVSFPDSQLGLQTSFAELPSSLTIEGMTGATSDILNDFSSFSKGIGNDFQVNQDKFVSEMEQTWKDYGITNDADKRYILEQIRDAIKEGAQGRTDMVNATGLKDVGLLAGKLDDLISALNGRR